MKQHPLQKYLPSLSAGLVNGVLIVIFQSAYAALIFSGDLAAQLPRGMGIMLFGAFSMGAIVALTSSFHSTVTAPQDAPTAIMSLIATAIAASVGSAAGGEAAFITVTAAIALTAVCTGLFLLALGWFKLGNLIRFIPYPVVGGFLAGTGWLLVKGAISIMSGHPLSFASAGVLMESAVVVKWLPGFLFAIVLFFSMQQFRHFLVMPAMIIGAIFFFYLMLFLTGTDIAGAAANGWLLPPLDGGIIWQPFSQSAFQQIDWNAIIQQSGNLATILVISVISLLLNASGLELIAGKEIDLNQELRSTGFANIVSGLGGSSVGYMSLSLSAFGFRIGSRSRLSGLTSAAICGLTLFLGAGIVAYFPKPLLGGLLLFLGISFLIEWLILAWFRLPKSEYLLVVLILITIGIFGFLEGMVLGTLISVILFVVNYSRIDVVKHTLSGKTYRSNVERAAPDRNLLNEYGDHLYILKLQGYIFFGTAHNVFNQVKDRLNRSDLPALQFVLLDFRLVYGVDSSALNSFEKMKLLAGDQTVIFCYTSLPPGVTDSFMRGGVLDPRHQRTRQFSDMDHGMEWIENELLRRQKEVLLEDTLPPSQEFLSQLFEMVNSPGSPAEISPDSIKEMIAFLEKSTFEEGEFLIEQGDPPKGIFILEEGRVTAQLSGQAGKTIRLRTMQPGTIIGELGVYLNTPATASVVADRHCVVWFLSIEGMRRMENEYPQLASLFHKLIIRILGERLSKSNQTLRALLGD